MPIAAGCRSHSVYFPPRTSVAFQAAKCHPSLPKPVHFKIRIEKLLLTHRSLSIIDAVTLLQAAADINLKSLGSLLFQKGNIVIKPLA